MNDSTAFADFINSLTPLNPEERQYVIDEIPVQSFPKGHLLLQEGEVMNYLYFVVKGCIRKYYNIAGIEKTTSFYEEQRLVYSWNSFINRTPSNHNLECIEDCRLAVVNRKVDGEAYIKYPIFDAIGRRNGRLEAIHHEEIIAELLTKNSTQRYTNFLERHPTLAQRIPQYQLATYLGIRPESLSRIRKKLAEQK